MKSLHYDATGLVVEVNNHYIDAPGLTRLELPEESPTIVAGQWRYDAVANNLIPLTEAEISENEAQRTAVRRQDVLSEIEFALRSTDWTQVQDELTPQKRAEYAAYRAKLRALVAIPTATAMVAAWPLNVDGVKVLGSLQGRRIKDD